MEKSRKESIENVRSLALRLMGEHGLTKKWWSFAFAGSVRRYGCCSYRGKKISVSSELASMNPLSVTENTVLHEIAHALVWPGHGHGRVWKRKAVEIGCDGQRCYDSSEVATPPRKYIGTCPGCGNTIRRHVRRDLACGKCCRGTYDPAFAFEFRLAA